MFWIIKCEIFQIMCKKMLLRTIYIKQLLSVFLMLLKLVCMNFCD
jgi:hypothetical protein